MKAVYPILIKDCGDCFIVLAPDWDTVTQGYSLHEAITMGRDAITTYVDIDTDEYRNRLEE